MLNNYLIKNRYLLRFLLISLIVIVLVSAFYLIVYAVTGCFDDYCQVGVGESIEVSVGAEFSELNNVSTDFLIRNVDCTNPIFVPKKTFGEWESFVNNFSYEGGCTQALVDGNELVIYVTGNSHNGDFFNDASLSGSTAREKLDSFCENNKPANLTCANTHAFISVYGDDESFYFPTIYGYDETKPIYWFNINGTMDTTMGNNWADIMDLTILNSQNIGTGMSGDNTVWSGAGSYGGTLETCSIWSVAVSDLGTVGNADAVNYQALGDSRPASFHPCFEQLKLRCVCETQELAPLYVHGCTDLGALNYDPLANVDDNSCFSCDDTIQNGDETGIDCGGSCFPCEYITLTEPIINEDYIERCIASIVWTYNHISDNTVYLEILDQGSDVIKTIPYSGYIDPDLMPINLNLTYELGGATPIAFKIYGMGSLSGEWFTDISQSYSLPAYCPSY